MSHARREASSVAKTAVPSVARRAKDGAPPSNYSIFARNDFQIMAGGSSPRAPALNQNFLAADKGRFGLGEGIFICHRQPVPAVVCCAINLSAARIGIKPCDGPADACTERHFGGKS